MAYPNDVMIPSPAPMDPNYLENLRRLLSTRESLGERAVFQDTPMATLSAEGVGVADRPAQATPVATAVVPQPPAFPSLSDWLGQLRGTGQQIVPSPGTDYFTTPEYRQQHPRLSPVIESMWRAAANIDPTGPVGREYAFRAARQAQLEGLPAAQVKAGLDILTPYEKAKQDVLTTQIAQQNAEANRMQANRPIVAPLTSDVVSPTGEILRPGVPSATAAGQPNIQSTVRQDPTSKTGYSEYIVGLDPVTGREAWAQRIGEASKPAMGTASGISPTAESNLMMKLSDRWGSLTKEVRDMQRQSLLMDAGMEAARRGDLAAGAQAVLVTFQKILDPTSVVRESEYARSAAGQSAISRIQGAYEQLASGGAGVPVSQLEKFAQLARDFVKTASSSSNLANEQKRVGMIADQYGIPREFIFGPVPITEQTPTQATTQATQLPATMIGPDGTVYHLQPDGTYK